MLLQHPSLINELYRKSWGDGRDFHINSISDNIRELLARVIYDNSVPVKCENFHFLQIYNEEIGAKCYEFHSLSNSEEKILG